MSFNNTPQKSRPAPGQQGSTPFRSASASRFRSSLVPMNRPSPMRSLNPSSKPAAGSSTQRDLFATSTPRTTRTAQFAPSLPAAATRPSPGVRKFAPQKSAHGGMSNSASTAPFKMRIPSPDPELNGEVLLKAIPDDPNRTGSAYADQFLAHKCPTHFDDNQRRQFFCVLDLRRLKYAANEIFAQKDWKLNIMNFSKEYEKSRGMIMLRYGQYEFKNVKPSEAVLKRWRAKHGLPDPEPQEDDIPSSGSAQLKAQAKTGISGSTKRKADDELVSKDNALMASTANRNKRRNLTQESTDPVLKGPAPFKKSKRKADETEDLDENQPNKQQKATPSAATSKFESILNKTQSGGASPLKRPTQGLTPLGAQKTRDPQSSSSPNKSGLFGTPSNGMNFGLAKSTNGGGSNGSILSGQKPCSTPAKNPGNIFSYLSESSASSSGNENDNADDGDDTVSESEQEPKGHDAAAAPSHEPSTVASQTGLTPFPASKTSTANIFGSGLYKPSSDASSKGGLFGRIQIGANGQPVRATPDVEEEGVGAAAAKTTPPMEPSKTPAKQPGDYTFNPATTPISFGQSGPGSSKPPSATLNAEAVKEPTKPDFASTKPSPIFNLDNQRKSETPTNTRGLFGVSEPSVSKPNNGLSSIFAGQKSTPAPTGLFGATPDKSVSENVAKPNEGLSSIFAGQKSTPAPTGLFVATPDKSISENVAKTTESKPSTAQGPLSGLFGKTPTDTTNTPKAVTPFGGAEKEDESSSSAPKGQSQRSIFQTSSTGANADSQAKTLFGGNGLKPNDSVTNGRSTSSVFANKDKPSTSSLFGTTEGSTMFGGAKTNGSSSENTKSVFSTAEKQPSAGFSFGSSKPGAPSEADKGSGLMQETKPTSAPAPAPSKPLFGVEAPKTASPAPPSLFGNLASTAGQDKQEEPAAKKQNTSGNAPASNGSIFSFGAQPAAAANAQPSSTPAVSFSAGSNASPSVSFGSFNSQNSQAGPKKLDFQFGGANPGASASPFAFGQDSSGGSGFTFTAGGGNGQSASNPFAAGESFSPMSPSLGGSSTTPTPSSSFNFNFGQQASPAPAAAPAASGNALFGGASNGTNGGPSFNFTQATPQSTPKPAPAGSGVFGVLNAGGEGALGANSPFAAPSSMGTTPVNGTPEPQAQNEDGEERQAQLSLTEGGPGEEDELILHEVRAKAIRYEPVQGGSSKSPWSTKGVGPLRVLKNKGTGTVRILLRAEPRGHIAMNKTILSDVEYTVKEKTVSFAAASDDGSCLETWLLQVKKPEMAHQLAGVMESNKSANKK
ncbi:Uu.00g097670.m01.CDS01 [Anthostomella pinea]|uniref:Uu.00g097670.m01.CDS01 n=1 Tax=Anthostomella pinea TaxID=933095 RepID=A0AAI8V7E0_9PEZI|nr:Uu.00g097670.m01.CDS01 [Anthostomella pinea]